MNTLTLTLLCALTVGVSAEISSHIVGGSNAEVNEFPWQGSLQYWYKETWYHICGCVLIEKRKVLTAAHCLFDLAETYRVSFGDWRLTEDDGTEQRSSLSYFVNHPEFSDTIPGYPNDIAVIILTTKMDTTSEAVSTIKLAKGCLRGRGIGSGKCDYAGKTATITGWGRLTWGGERPDILQKVDTPVLSNEDCLEKWVDDEWADIGDGHICVFDEGKSSGCNGDSGGPMVVDDTLVGLTSWGKEGCTTFYPTVYTRVSHYYKWIKWQ